MRYSLLSALVITLLLLIVGGCASDTTDPPQTDTTPGAFAAVTPPANSTGLDAAVAFTWAKSDRATQYILRVSTASNMASPVVSTNLQDVQGATIGGLVNGTMYYWQVIASNAAGTALSGPSMRFSTGAPAAFTLVGPPNHATGQGDAPQLSWQAKPGATNYRIVVSVNPGLGSPLYDTLAGPTNVFPTANLSSATKYYWTVTAYNSFGATATASGTWDLTVSANPSEVPAAFTLTAPAAAATSQATNMTFTWAASTRATNYVLQVSTVSTFASFIFNGLTGGASQTIPNLSLGTMYYWKVKAVNKDGETWNTGSYRSFTTGNIPGAFTLSTPANAATAQASTVTMTWAASSGATSYVVVLSANSDLSSPLFSGDVGLVTSKAQAGLSASTVYYWSVSAVNAFGTRVSTTGTRSFTTGSTPGAFSLTAPANATNFTPQSPTCTWGAASGVTSYQLVISVNADLSSPIVDLDVGNVTSRAVTTLAANTTYFWKATAKNSWGNVDATGGTRSFTTGRRFWAQNIQASTWYSTDARLVSTGTYGLVYVEGSRLSTVSAATCAAIASKFDASVYPMVTTKFAPASDVDGNGKVVMLILNILDGWSGSGGYVAGYFDPTQDFTGVNSNLADMLYMDAYPAVAGSADFMATIAHEFQHLCNFNQTYLVGNKQKQQEVWINEGLSSAAEYLHQGSHIAWKINYYNTDPATVISQGENFMSWGSWGDPLANYSTVYLFFQWLRIQASNGDGIYAEILAQTVYNADAVVNVASSRLYSASWYTFLTDWFTANLYNNGTGKYGYKGELTLTPHMLTGHSGETWPLLPGEGVYVSIPGTQAMSYGMWVDYMGLNTSSKTTPDYFTPYLGDVLLCYNWSKTWNGAAENTQALPAYSKPASFLPRAALLPDEGRTAYPIDVVFGADGANPLQRVLPNLGRGSKSYMKR